MGDRLGIDGNSTTRREVRGLCKKESDFNPDGIRVLELESELRIIKIKILNIKY